MRKLSLLILCGILFCMIGCASVPLYKPEEAASIKEFAPPSPGMAGLYIFRDGILGAGLLKDIWVDGQCVGQSASNVFFYREVSGDTEHVITTESEFSPNELKIFVESDTLYFIRQYLKPGLVVGGADLEIVEPEFAKAIVVKLDMAVGGDCDNPTP